MNPRPREICLMKITGVQKSRETVPLMYMLLIKTDNLRRYPISVPMLRIVIAV